MTHPFARARNARLLPLVLLLACATGRTTAPGPAFQTEPSGGILRLALYSNATGEAEASGAPAPRSWQALTVARLVSLAQERDIGVTGASVTRNREIGLAFQGAINRSLNIPINSAAFPTSVRNGNVIPDGLVTAQMLSLLGGASVDPEGAFLEVIGHDFLDLLEVKARRSRITPSTARRQILGFIDVLEQRRLRSTLPSLSGPPRPALLLVTTADTEVSEDVVWEAARRGVAIYQALAEESQGEIRVSAFIQKTSFADAPMKFQFPSAPMPLQLR